MSVQVAILRARTRVAYPVDRVIRLDHIRNPYGPCPAALEAIQKGAAAPLDTLVTDLRQRLGRIHAIPLPSIHLLRSVDSGLDDILQNQRWSLVSFSPSTLATRVGQRPDTLGCVSIARAIGRDSIIGRDVAADLPVDGIAVIDSPSDPLGSLLSAADVVRLSRACRFVVIDERFAEFSSFSMLPLALEFENVVVLRSFEAWSGIPDPACAWAVASPRSAFDLNLGSAVVEPKSIAAALATLDNLASVGATLKLVRGDRSRLYRMLRKLSFLEPIPSWAPFLAARVQLVDRQEVIDGLMARQIFIHAPAEMGLERFVRIGIGLPTAMERLRKALLEFAPELVS